MSAGSWMKPYLDQVNPMIDRIAKAQAGGPPITDEEMRTWRNELATLLEARDTDLLHQALEARKPEMLVLVAGRIMGRRSVQHSRKIEQEEV